MISTLELSHFRGLEHVKFENLDRANLIVGGNNTGKTSILEALVLLYGDQAQLQSLPTTFRERPSQQDKQGKEFWPLLAKNSETSGFTIFSNDDILIASFTNGRWSYGTPNGSKAINVKYSVEDFRREKTRFKLGILATKQSDPSYLSELFTQVAPLNPDNEAKLEDLLRTSIEPRLRRLRYAKPQGAAAHLIYADLGSAPMLPFTQLGQAFARTLQVYCEIFANRPKILLVDEIENGLYFEGLEDYWKGLMAVLEDQDVQLFATTHSRECMEAAQRAAASMEGNPLRFLRLDRRVDDPQKIVATTFGQEEMQTAINSNLEMR